MNQIVTMIIFILMCILGGLSSLYVVTALPAMLIWKLYRKLRYQEKII